MQVCFKAFLVIVLATVFAPLSSHAADNGPSFSCAGAKDIEAAICADAGLSAADRRLAHFYGEVKTDILGVGPSGQLAVQRRWLKDLNGDCGAKAWVKQFKSQAECVRGHYDTRLQDLAVSALIQDHDAAMAELRRTAPHDAPVYEAIYLYTTTDNPQARAAKVAAALTPVYAGIPDKKAVFSELDGPETPQAAAAADKAFVLFAQLYSGTLDTPLSWPCAAIPHRPGLIGALDGLWGSSRDNFLPQADCEIMAPQVPAFTGFVDTLQGDAPQCDGTIRYAGYRQFERLKAAALLHRAEAWKDEKVTPPEAGLAKYLKTHAQAAAKAKAALAQYYQTTFKLPPDRAAAEAAVIFALTTALAYDPCDG
ncbi:lysozyme inhibitor LprI family protein [Asticcacaulis solisilvae]|uniref:lysozyme inhibitor LprI family protein n=1 Tax=Asticcacaulis solisilvae TaxID=1217274 RepID=UPI003FD8B85B